VKTSPLHQKHLDLQAKMADFGGWLMPIEYPGAGVLAEHAAVRERVGLFDVSHLGKASVTGVGALDFLNSQFTNDLNRISDSKAQYTLYCTPEGGVIDDLIVYRNSAEDFFLAGKRPSRYFNYQSSFRICSSCAARPTSTRSNTEPRS
jgi:aminomethyltransferase